MIYFDNAATSLKKPPKVSEAVADAIKSFGGAGRGGHPASMEASRCVFKARCAVARLLGSNPQRTAFTSNATESLNTAIFGLLTPEDHVITTVLEHNSVLRPLYALNSWGMGLDFINADSQGNLDYNFLRSALKHNTKAVVCTHASNLLGTVTDLSLVSEFCRENGLLLIVDAAQTAGSTLIDTVAMGIDVLCFTGHKGLMGPQGTGGLCLGEGVPVRPLKVGGSGLNSYDKYHPGEMPEALEAGTVNAHGLAGLLEGVRFIEETGIESINKHEQELVSQFLQGVSDIPGVKLYGDFKKPRAPVISLNIGTLGSGEVADRLARDYGICVRGGAHCAPLAHRAMGTEGQGAVRFSFSYFNTSEEISEGIRAVREIAGCPED